MSLYTIKSILVLDNDGHRIAAKYYTDEYPSVKEQRAFETNLFNKTHRANGEIIMIENVISLYRASGDCFFYVNGPSDENELLLLSVLSGLYETLSIILRGQIDKRMLLENFDAVLLTIDEMVDRGVILETDPQVIAPRVSMKDAISEVPISEQTASQTFSTIAEKLKNQFLKGT